MLFRSAAAQATGHTAAIDTASRTLKNTRTLRFNSIVDVIVTSLFLTLVAGVFLLSVLEWLLLLARRRPAKLHEADAVWLPDYAIAEGKPVQFLGLFALALGLLRHWTDASAIDRAGKAATTVCVRDGACDCAPTVNLLGEEAPLPHRGELYAKVVDERFRGVNRCC